MRLRLRPELGFFPRDPRIMLGSARRVGQDFVGLVDEGHDAGGARVIGILVRVVFLAEGFVGRADDEIRRVAGDF